MRFAYFYIAGIMAMIIVMIGLTVRHNVLDGRSVESKQVAESRN